MLTQTQKYTSAAVERGDEAAVHELEALDDGDDALRHSGMPRSRKLLAVPFVGKDAPSPAAEFSHPDVAIGRFASLLSLLRNLTLMFLCSADSAGVSVRRPAPARL